MLHANLEQNWKQKKTNGELSITFTTNINNNDFFLNKHLM